MIPDPTNQEAVERGAAAQYEFVEKEPWSRCLKSERPYWLECARVTLSAAYPQQTENRERYEVDDPSTGEPLPYPQRDEEER